MTGPMLRALVLGCALIATTALAIEPELPGCRDSGQKGVTVHLRDSFWNEMVQRLSRGLSVTIRHKLMDSPSQSTGTRSTRGCRITFDLWDERYTIVPLDAAGSAQPAEAWRQTRELSAFPEECLTVIPTRDEEIAARSAGAYVVTTQLNPVPQEQINRTRQWLAATRESGSGTMVGRAALAMLDLSGGESFTTRCSPQGSDE